MNKQKLIKLRCKAWGITEDEYYCNQCSDFSLEDMARAYRRGKNKGRAEIAKENANLRFSVESTRHDGIELLSDKRKQLTKAKEIIKKLLHSLRNEDSDYTFALESTHPVLAEAEQFLKEIE